MKSLGKLIAGLDEFVPTDGNWRELDSLISDACATKDQRVIRPLLAVLERNPDEDGAGVFWSIVHGLEWMGGYEAELLYSVSTKPHYITLVMLNRMLNAEIKEINGKPILEILEATASNNSFPVSIQDQANDLLSFQKENM